MSPDTSYLRDMLAQDSAAVAQLKTLLLTERQKLEERQLQGLQEIITQKDKLVESLAFSAKQREQALRAAGLETTLIGWEKFLLRSPATLSLIPGWQALTAEFVECQKANEINGRMINRSKQTLSHLLNLIRGQVAMPSLYTQTGTTTNQNNSYTVAKA